MGRNKHSTAKEIIPSISSDDQLNIALLGKFQHMADLYILMEDLRSIPTPKDARKHERMMKADFFKESPESCEEDWTDYINTQRDEARRDVTELKESLLKWVLDAVQNGKPQNLRDLASVLEILVKGDPVSPIEWCLSMLKLNREVLSRLAPESAEQSPWPLTISEIKRRISRTLKKEYSTTAIRDAAQRIALPYKEGRGRPSLEQKN
jgi:hypothetical protein